MAGVTRDDIDWSADRTSYPAAVRFRWWLARSVGSLSDGRRAVLGMALLAPLTFLAIFLVVLAIS